MEKKEYKLNVGKIQEGFVIDHIHQGRGMDLYHYLGLDKSDYCVALIKNASSKKMGRKDIIKVECPIDEFDTNIIAFLDHTATVDVIKDGEIIDKPKLDFPKEIRNVIKCKNPRCITSVEHQLDSIFYLSDASNGTYRCHYCEAEWTDNCGE
ncbi:MAG: aspartate carbamoyltransferase regulatory subunit [Lachnospiraceae bacterium]|nr:aspartate carbamoyltransferase regulatory subunit [Lachnospiraceae bacterium]MDN4743038.1 aspartate carbamoyltransferase regulatory subunit [Lachnospiraceae bacterium C1.1]